MLLAGGIIYTIGGIIYALKLYINSKYPFGSHEIFTCFAWWECFYVIFMFRSVVNIPA